MLPNFLIVGARRAGSTSLFKYLGEHPEIFVPTTIKETNFFLDDSDVRSKKEYEALFAAASESRRGEASPNYLHSREACTRIHATIPNAKIIISLRNPADRVRSMFIGQQNRGRKEGWHETIHNTQWLDSHRYLPGVQMYAEQFDTHIMKFEDFSHDPENECSRIFKFLGVDDAFRPRVEDVHNRGGVPRSQLLYRLFRSGMGKYLPKPIKTFLRPIRRRNLVQTNQSSPDDRHHIIEYYQEEIEALGRYIDVSDWR